MTRRPSLRSPRSLALLFTAVSILAPFGGAECATAAATEVSRPVRGSGLGLVIAIEGRDHSVKADASHAATLRVGFTKGEPTASGRSIIEKFARDSEAKQASRILIIGGVGVGETPNAGFQRARVLRDRLIAAGWSADRLVVAGWRTASVLPTALGQVDQPDTFVVVPLIEEVRVISPSNGDPGRALALDSAYSRLAVVTTTASPVAASPRTSAESKPVIVAPPPTVEPPAAKPPKADPIARLIVANAPSTPAAPTGRTPVVEPSRRAIEPLPITAAPVHTPNPTRTDVRAAPAVIPATTRVETGCAVPHIVMDDFYAGGPFRDCNGRRRVISR